MSATEAITTLGKQAKQAGRALSQLTSEVKNAALEAMAQALLDQQAAILAANAEDLAHADEFDLTAAMKKRLKLDAKKIAAMADGLRQVASLTDPVGSVVDGWRRPNGLSIRRVRVPLGVIGIIYESRPNVTADCAGLCVKSGNAVILRGGTEAIRSNTAIARTLARAATASGLPVNTIQLVEDTSRELATALMQAEGYVDCIIPRGGAGLIKALQDNAKVPYILDGAGVCHSYVDSAADLDMALAVAVNAKCQYPAVCNAMETLLVHQHVAPAFLPRLAKALAEEQCELRGCDRTRAILPEAVAATDEDWSTEYSDLILSVKVVDSLDAAMDHIAIYGTLHSECILTTDLLAAQRFCREVDAAAVYVNASTRFTDGERFGFGAEIGISTQKLHARGPLGLAELCSVKYLVEGNGQIV